MKNLVKNNIQDITVVGAGTAGYFTVFHLCTTYPNKNITWIYPKENEPIGVGEAVVPHVNKFLSNLGIKLQDILKHCNGTLKLGLFFEDWPKPGENFSLPSAYNSKVQKYNTVSQDEIIKTKKIPKNIFDYSDNISCHFRVTDLLSYFDTMKGKFKNLKILEEKTNLEKLKNTYDLLIDCTGFERKISFIPNNFKSINHIIPNDQVFLYRQNYTDREKQCVPYTVMSAMEYGWCFNIPLRNELACGYVHDSKFDVYDEFLRYLNNKFSVEINPQKIKKIKMISGRNEIHLRNNIVSIGLSSSFIEPLQSTGLSLVIHSIEKLCEYIEGKINQYEYNMHINNMFDYLVKFILIHYKFSKRKNDYWNHFKSLPLENISEILEYSNSDKPAWDYILSGFLSEIKRPIESMDVKEIITIHKGQRFDEWILNEENYT